MGRLDETYPFGEQEYNTETDLRLNPNRVAWVDHIIAGRSPEEFSLVKELRGKMPENYAFMTLEEVRRYRGPIRLAATGLHVVRYFEITRAALLEQITTDPKFWSEYTVYFSEENQCLYVEGNYN